MTHEPMMLIALQEVERNAKEQFAERAEVNETPPRPRMSLLARLFGLKLGRSTKQVPTRDPASARRALGLPGERRPS